LKIRFSSFSDIIDYQSGATEVSILDHGRADDHAVEHLDRVNMSLDDKIMTKSLYRTDWSAAVKLLAKEDG
jgi:hypothetical protein